MLPRLAEVVILAGGVSRRMGSPKALLHYSSRETFLDRILAVYRAAGIERATVVWAHSARRDPRILYALSHPKCVSLKITHEFHDDPDADRLASVLRGLRQADEYSSIFLQDVDRPFVTAAAISTMLACGQAEGYVAPNILGRAGHPLLLSPQIVSALLQEHRRLIAHDQRCVPPKPSTTLRDLLQEHHCTLIPIESKNEAALLEVNINTPGDYRRYFPSSYSMDDRSSMKELVTA